MNGKLNEMENIFAPLMSVRGGEGSSPRTEYLSWDFQQKRISTHCCEDIYDVGGEFPLRRRLAAETHAVITDVHR